MIYECLHESFSKQDVKFNTQELVYEVLVLVFLCSTTLSVLLFFFLFHYIYLRAAYFNIDVKKKKNT